MKMIIQNQNSPNGSYLGSVSPAQGDPTLVNNDLVAKVVSNSSIKSPDLGQFAEPSREVVAKAATQIHNFVQSMGITLNFSIDKSTGFHVVQVVDPATNQLIRQLPSKELLEIAKSMDQLKNSLVSQTA